MVLASRRIAEIAGHGTATSIPEVLSGGIAVAIAGANVIMQLSFLPIGHGVAESRVESGRLDKHPLKRFRTTFTFIAVAAGGNDQERLALRREVNRAHRRVRSRPSDVVQYDAFDPAQQLWVSACLYRGVEVTYSLLYGTPDEYTAEELYRECAKFGTTLQVPAHLWPRDRGAFDEYWQGVLDAVEMDEVTRTYLRNIATLGFLPEPVRSVVGPLNQFVTTGFLSEPFRSELGLPWGAARQLGFEVVTRTGAWATRRLPAPVRAFPFNYLLWDFRRRSRAGRPIV